MPDFFFIAILIAATVAALVAAVDAARRHPVLWEHAGRSLRLRAFVVLSPIFAISLLPVGIGITVYYFARARPDLIAAARRGVHVPPGGSLGIGRTWRELGWWQRVKTVLAIGIAAVLEFSAFREGGPEGASTLTVLFLIPVVFILMVVAVYIGLSFFPFVMAMAFGGRGRRGLVNDKTAMARAKRRSDHEWRQQQNRW